VRAQSGLSLPQRLFRAVMGYAALDTHPTKRHSPL
jgi:hypothetical protein